MEAYLFLKIILKREAQEKDLESFGKQRHNHGKNLGNGNESREMSGKLGEISSTSRNSSSECCPALASAHLAPPLIYQGDLTDLGYANNMLILLGIYCLQYSCKINIRIKLYVHKTI